MRLHTQSRRIINGVMKSPSPDIANRNIIKNTQTPIVDVKIYLERQGQSHSPRISDLSHSARLSSDNTQVQMLRKKVKQLEKRDYEQIQLIKKYGEMIKKLEGSGQKLRDHSNSSDDRDEESARTLELLQQKICKLVEENKRLGGLIKDKQANIQSMNAEIKIIKNQIQALDLEQFQETQKPVVPIHTDNWTGKKNQNESSSSEQIVRIKDYLKQIIETEMKRSEDKIMNEFYQLCQKLKKIEQNQVYIKKQFSKTSLIKTPQKNYHHSSSSTHAFDFNSDQKGFSNSRHSFEPQPFWQISGLKTERNPDSPQSLKYCEDMIKNLSLRIEQLTKQNFDQKNKIIETQELLRKSTQNQSSSFNIKYNEQADKFTRKIRQLQDELDQKNMSLSKTQRQLSSFKDNYHDLQQNTKREMDAFKKLKSEKDNEFDDLNKKYNSLEFSYSKLKSSLSGMEKQLQQKQYANQELKSHLKLQFDSREENVKRYYEDILKNKDRSIGQHLHQYLQILHNIRRQIQDGNADQVVDECQQAINEKITIEKQIIYIKQENQRIVYEIKKRMIEQEQTIIQLEKDNKLLQTQISQLQKQKSKLKNAMLDFESYKPAVFSSFNTASSTTQRFESGCKLKSCLKETVRKIDGLQHQITNILME